MRCRQNTGLFNSTQLAKKTVCTWRSRPRETVENEALLAVVLLEPLLDEPDDAEDVPGFLQPIEAEINYVTVEYSLYEFEYWLPRRFAMEEILTIQLGTMSIAGCILR